MRNVQFALFVSLLGVSLHGLLKAQTLQQNLWVTAGGPANGQVNAIVYSESTNTIYLGGSFDYVGPHTDRGAALSVATGSADPDFPKVNGIIRAVVPDGAGGWFIGGDFTSVSGVTRNRLAHIKSDKSLDMNWNPRTTNGAVYALALSGSKLYVGGTFSTIGDSVRGRIAALDVTTGSVSSWNRSGAGGGNVLALAVSGARVYAGGNFTSMAGIQRTRLAAIDTNGVLVGTWTPSVTSAGTSVYDIKVLADRVYICGSFTQINTNNIRNRLAAIDTSGALIDWTPSANNDVWTIAVSGSTVYAGGEFTNISNNPRQYIAAIDAVTGSPRNWPNASSYVYSLALSGSVLYAGGIFTTIGNLPRNRMAAIDTSTGVSISTWNPNANAAVRAISVTGSTLYAGGEFTTIGGITRNRIAAFDGATGLPTDWNPNASGEVNALALSGSILYVGGAFTAIGDSNRSRIAALHTATGKATGWNPTLNTNTGAVVNALAVSGPVVYVGGSFTTSGTIGGRPRNRIAAISTSTGLATNWNPNVETPGSVVYAVAVSGSTVYVGGNFTGGTWRVGGQLRNRIAALDATIDTLNATGWDPNANGPVYAILPFGSRVFVGGAFTSIGIGTPQPQRGRIAALDSASGDAMATWQANVPDYSVQSLALAGSSLYAGGNFTSIGGQNRNRLAALDRETGTPTPWNPNVFGSNLTYVNAIAISFRNSRIYVGGNFEEIRNETRTGFAGMDNPIDPPVSVREVEHGLAPESFLLGQNYPNPFNPSTNIRFQIPSSAFVTLAVYDILGREVATLVSEQLNAGSYEATFSARGGSASGGDGVGLASGVYFYRLQARPTAGGQAGNFVQTRKLILQK